MPIVPLAAPYAMNNAKFEVVADDFSEAISQVQLDPTVAVSTFRAIDGSVRRRQSTSEWSCTLSGAQDLDPDGLTRYLLDHDGESRVVTLTPENGGPVVEVTLILAAATIGGTAGADLAGFSTTLAVDGKPVFIDAPDV